MALNLNYQQNGAPSQDYLTLLGYNTNNPMLNQSSLGAGITNNQAPQTSSLLDGLDLGGVMSAFNTLAGGVNAYTGLKQLGLAEDTFNFNRDAFNANFANQAQTINTQLEDRQRARIAANPGAYESLNTYLDKHAVKSTIGG